MDKISSSNILVVGAGGIGCELLKTLVLWNFNKITVVDLDTIDVSNLNRQFLFRKEHVGKSKSLTAKESVLKFNPNANINAICDDILSAKYDTEFYKSFTLVMNALDNKTARNHVNRMCSRANVNLIESGTMGYRGQVQVILRNKSACYECFPKPAQKSYPACTIRNTPSEPIHCVVWAKYLFNQLFGEADNDEEVIPDQNDPELLNENSLTEQNGNKTNGNGENSTKVNIRTAWKDKDGCFDAQKLLEILFVDNIQVLLSLKDLWIKNNRVKPDLLSKSIIKSHLTDPDVYISQVTGGVHDQKIYQLEDWCHIFKSTSLKLADKVAQIDSCLIWDKDDALGMDFVAAAANIRMQLFHIEPLLSRFQIKSMAGNIIPAIATTNAIIAACCVIQAYKVITNQLDSTRDVMLSELVSARGKIIQAVEPQPPQNDCYVCSLKYILMLHLPDFNSISLAVIKNQILEQKLCMVAPNVTVQNKSILLIDGAEEDEDKEYLSKTLDQFHLENGTILRCSDFLQNYEFGLVLVLDKSQSSYRILGPIDDVVASAKPEEEEEETMNNNNVSTDSRKRKLSDHGDGELDTDEEPVAKKVKLSNDEEDNSSDELIIMDI